MGIRRCTRLPARSSTAPCRDERRAGDRGSAFDGSNLSVASVMSHAFDIVIVGSGAGGSAARELAGTGAKILIVERGGFIPQEDHNWNPSSVWKDLRYRTTETWLDEDGQPFRPYALLRRRQHEVLGHGDVLAAAGGFQGDGARRRRVAGVADRLRHWRALRSGGADVQRSTASTASIPPNRRADRILSAGAAFEGGRRDRRTAGGAGPASIAAAAGPARTASSPALP